MHCPHILTAACSTVTQLQKGGGAGGSALSVKMMMTVLLHKHTQHTHTRARTHPLVSSTHELKLDARYLLHVTEPRSSHTSHVACDCCTHTTMPLW